MDRLDLDVLTHARDWLRSGHTVHLVTVLSTWGSAPRPAGSMMALRGDGVVVGSVSGGCIEDDLIDRLAHGETVTQATSLLYGVTGEQASRFGLPCGGQLRLLQEPLAGAHWLDELLQRCQSGRLVVRHLDLRTGKVTLADGGVGDRFSFDGQCMQSVHGPGWRLLLVGAGPISQYLAGMAPSLDFAVHCCDPRPNHLATWPHAHIPVERGMPDDWIRSLAPDAHTAVAALSHDRKLDDLALLEALPSSAFYVGALGSRRHTAERKARLSQMELSAEQIERLHGPIGLDLGGHAPTEIALSVLAELVAVRHGVPLRQKKPPHVEDLVTVTDR